jgi:hypothetical protein
VFDPEVVAQARAVVEYFEEVLPQLVLLAAAFEVAFRGHVAARTSPFQVV